MDRRNSNRGLFCMEVSVIDCKKADWYNTYEKVMAIWSIFVIVLKKWLHMYKGKVLNYEQRSDAWTGNSFYALFCSSHDSGKSAAAML